MKQYIDKSAVVAEIEKRLKANGAFDEVGDEAWAEDKGMCEAYRSILSFIDTLEVKEVSSKNPDEKMIVKYLYEKKGYPIDLNGNIPSFEETMKDVENYNKYKEDKFIEKACQFIKEHHHEFSFWNTEEYELGFSTQKFIEDFKKYMEE